MVEAYILDTNIVSALIRKDEKITKKLIDINNKGDKICISILTDYEIRRGLFAANATGKLRNYEMLRNQFKVIWFDNLELSEKAAKIHADLKKKGQPIPDADILIAATAMIKNLIVVTNDEHFLRIPELKVENWINS